MRGTFFALRIAGVWLAAWIGAAKNLPAQSLRLAVHPRDMATATRTEQAGLQTLDGQPKAPPDPSQGMCATLGMTSGCVDTGIGGTGVYVPRQCVGARRCPLILLSNTPYEYYVQVADKYGMILGVAEDEGDNTDSGAIASINRGMQQILRTFAIDPDKIVIAGRCATGPWTVGLGAQNLDVFSRIAVFTQHTGAPLAKGPTQANEYFITGGITENISNFWGVRRLRKLGYPVKYSIQFRGHTHTYEDYDFMGRWLQESWAVPNPAARPAPVSFGEPPLLTTEILDRMTAFWTRFTAESDSVTTTAHRALVREVALAVGNEPISTLMVDMAALAARYPSVAAALKAAGLTAEQHDVYRAALAGARIYDGAFATAGTAYDARGMTADSVAPFLGVAPTSALAKNREFMVAHPDEMAALEATQMWVTP